MIQVHVTGHLRDYTGKRREFEISKTKDVRSMLHVLDQMFPGIRDRILDDQEKTRPYVNIFVNGTNIREGAGEDTRLKDGDTIHILPSVAGGRHA
jgi:molybdopterin synthase sulfur carrier subunit